MARLVAAFGSSHSTMLLSPLEHWLKLFDTIDCKAPLLDLEGRKRSFDELLQALPADAAARIAPAAIAERHKTTCEAMDRLQADIAAAHLDALIVVGDDQREIFKDSLRPAVGIYHGDLIRNAAAPVPPPPAEDWYHRDQAKRLEDGADAHYACHPGLARHLIEGLTQAGFDITALGALAPEQFEGHAYSFIHRRYLASGIVPMVPVFLNTYYPPNQPTPQRCRQLGAALRDGVAAYAGDIRVGILASGGLSHFLVNEALDRQVLEHLRQKDLDALASIPASLLESGSSEIRNWICTAAAAVDLDLQWIQYIPGYRSRALTGVGLCFAHWCA